MSGDSAAQGNGDSDAAPRTRNRRSRGGRGGHNEAGALSQSTGNPNEDALNGVIEDFQQLDVSRNEPISHPENSVFVANLPFSIKNDQLTAVFEENGFQVKSSYVAIRWIGGRGRSRRVPRSKGFGFVELASAEEQIRAAEVMTNVEIDGRAIVVKVASSDSEREPEESNLS